MKKLPPSAFKPMLSQLRGGVGLALLAAALLLYPIIFPGPFYRDIGVTFLLAAISASAVAPVMG